MRRWVGCTVAFVLMVTRAARADELVSIESELRPVALDLAPVRGRLRAGGFVQLVGGAALAEGAVGGEVVYEAGDCRLLAAGGQARLRAGARAERRLSAEQWMSSCLWRANSGLPGLVELRHELAWEVRPALSAPRAVWRGTYTRERVDGTLDLFHFTDGRTVATVWRMQPGVTFLRQRDGEGGRRQLAFDSETAVLHMEHATVGPLARLPLDTLDVLAMRVHTIFGGDGTTTGELVFGGFTGLRLGRGVQLDGELALAVGDLDAPGIYHFMTPVGRLEARTGTPRTSARLAVGRTLQATFDDELLLEDRLTSGLDYGHGRLALGLEAFLARTVVRGADGVSPAELTGGAAARAGFALGHGVSLAVTGELARSYYARLDGGRTPQAELAATLLGVLELRWYAPRHAMSGMQD